MSFASPTAVRLLALAVLVSGGVIVLLLLGSRRQPDRPSTAADAPDPRLTFETPFRNVKPDVGYVGDTACQPCHRELCQSFHQQAMGRSAELFANAERIERFGEKSRNEFKSPSGVSYRAELRDGKLIQTESVVGQRGNSLAETRVDATFVIGSGQQARSYLAVRDGSLWQTGLTWYRARQCWDTSPGFAPGMHGQRQVVEICMFCHVDRVELVPGTTNRYREPLFPRQASISCERCHGPGALHVDERTAGMTSAGIDTSIVNPKHLPPDVRDAVCAQCHLQGEYITARRGRSHFDFRPGLPLELFRDVFVNDVRDGDDLGFVGHVEQMAASKCATASAGKLSCTSCHDPHADPPKGGREKYFRDACLTCHADRGCSLPVAERHAKNDVCASCHMPRREAMDISHTAVTDHRILRKSAARKPIETSGRLISYFSTSRHAPPEYERDRDLALAQAFLILEKHDRTPGLLDNTAERLAAATARFPNDAEAWIARSKVHSARGQWPEAWTSIETAIAVQPRREAALQQATLAAIQLGKPEQATQFAREAVEMNPGSSINRINLGLALHASREWQAAADALRVGLSEMPLNSGGRAALAVCLHYLGERTASLTELQRAAELSPNEALALRDWFALQTR